MRAVLRTIREEGLASQGESEGLGESNQGEAEQERMRGGGHRPGAKVAQQLQTETLPNPKGAATHERSGDKGASTSTPEHRPGLDYSCLNCVACRKVQSSALGRN